MPIAALMLVDEWPASYGSYSDSFLFWKPETPSTFLKLSNGRPDKTLCA